MNLDSSNLKQTPLLAKALLSGKNVKVVTEETTQPVITIGKIDCKKISERTIINDELKRCKEQLSELKKVQQTQQVIDNADHLAMIIFFLFRYLIKNSQYYNFDKEEQSKNDLKKLIKIYKEQKQKFNELAIQQNTIPLYKKLKQEITQYIENDLLDIKSRPDPTQPGYDDLQSDIQPSEDQDIQTTIIQQNQTDTEIQQSPDETQTQQSPDLIENKNS